MSVWYAIPTAAPTEQARRCLEAWRGMGYRVATAFEGWERAVLPADLRLMQPEYHGYAATVDALVKQVLAHDPGCQVVVTGGDDTYPDPVHRADEIAAEFVGHFGRTLGVLQPTGDPWTTTMAHGLKMIERAAGSPWLGREWCERAYEGRGPLWPEYYHFWVDGDLQAVAEKLGLFWQRPDLVHRHDNWKRERRMEGRPPHLRKAAEMWGQDRDLFELRKAEGFPSSNLT